MSESSYYRGRVLEKEVIFDFSADTQTATREELLSSFVAQVAKLQAQQNRTAVDEIEIRFLNDSLSKLRAGHPLIPVTYSK